MKGVIGRLFRWIDKRYSAPRKLKYVSRKFAIIEKKYRNLQLSHELLKEALYVKNSRFETKLEFYRALCEHHNILPDKFIRECRTYDLD